MAQAVAGTALVAGGAAVLNQVYERDTDALMRRTRMRAAARRARRAGRRAAVRHRARRRAASRCWPRARTCSPRRSRSRRSSSTWSIYTPMKRRSSSPTLVGAVPGALPPLIGWTRVARQRLARRRRAVRDRVPLADSALHGDRVDVPRRLRARPAFRCCRSSSPTAGAPGARPWSTRRALVPVEPVADARRRQRHRSTWSSRSCSGVGAALAGDPLRGDAHATSRRARCSSDRSPTCRSSGSR